MGACVSSKPENPHQPVDPVGSAPLDNPEKMNLEIVDAETPSESKPPVPEEDSVPQEPAKEQFRTKDCIKWCKRKTVGFGVAISKSLTRRQKKSDLEDAEDSAAGEAAEKGKFDESAKDAKDQTANLSDVSYPLPAPPDATSLALASVAPPNLSPVADAPPPLEQESSPVPPPQEAPPSKDANPGPSVLERHNVSVLGEGKELLLMSHGFGTNHQIWGGVLERLDLFKQYRVILWDLMGAYSTNPEGFDFKRYSSLHGYADDLLEVLDELEVESCTYIGHSVSGMIGVIASIERPSVFKRLILIGASPRYLDSPGYKGGFTLELLDQVFAAMQDNYKVWASGFAPMVIGEDVESPHVREFCRSLFLIRPDIAFSTLRTIFTCDLRHILPQVSVQVHLLQTARDAAVPWDAVQYMLDHIPNACVEMVPVAGHLPHLTHPETIADALLRHLAMPLRQSTLPAFVGEA